MASYITEALKTFNLLESEEFSLDQEGIDALNDALNIEDEDENISVIDPEAETDEELKQSYVGKVICDCNVCHSNVFYNKEDIVIDDDGIVNIEDECPYCMSTDGYTIVGEIAPYNAEEEIPEENGEVEDDFEEVMEESYRRRKLKEGKGYLVDIDSQDYDIIFSDGQVYSIREFSPELNRELAYGAPEDKIVDKLCDMDTAINNRVHSPRLTYKIECRDIPESHIIHRNNVDEFNEGMQLSSKKELNGKKSLRRVDKLDADKKIRGRNNTKLSGNLDLHEAMIDVDTKGDSTTVETDDEQIHIEKNENGGISINTNPLDAQEISDSEAIAPLSNETLNDLGIDEDGEQEIQFDDFDLGNEDVEDNFLDNEETPENEESEEGEESEEVAPEDFDEKAFDELGESFLRRTYGNVASFKTTGVTVNENLMKVNGLISFNSGSTKRTSFIFEASKMKGNKITFKGLNEQFAKDSNAFMLKCELKESMIKPLALKYNYSVRKGLKESVNVKGTVSIKG